MLGGLSVGSLCSPHLSQQLSGAQLWVDAKRWDLVLDHWDPRVRRNTSTPNSPPVWQTVLLCLQLSSGWTYSSLLRVLVAQSQRCLQISPQWTCRLTAESPGSVCSSVQEMEVYLRGLKRSVPRTAFTLCGGLFISNHRADPSLAFTKKKQKGQDCQWSGTGSSFDMILICRPSRDPDGHESGGRGEGRGGKLWLAR